MKEIPNNKLQIVFKCWWMTQLFHNPRRFVNKAQFIKICYTISYTHSTPEKDVFNSLTSVLIYLHKFRRVS